MNLPVFDDLVGFFDELELGTEVDEVKFGTVWAFVELLGLNKRLTEDLSELPVV